MTCIHSGNLHICFAVGRYVGQVRGFGCRKWRTVTGKRRTANAALAAAVLKMKHDDKRARALFIPRSTRRDPDWYGPSWSMEAYR